MTCRVRLRPLDVWFWFTEGYSTSSAPEYNHPVYNLRGSGKSPERVVLLKKKKKTSLLQKIFPSKFFFFFPSGSKIRSILCSGTSFLMTLRCLFIKVSKPGRIRYFNVLTTFLCSLATLVPSYADVKGNGVYFFSLLPGNFRECGHVTSSRRAVSRSRLTFACTAERSRLPTDIAAEERAGLSRPIRVVFHQKKLHKMHRRF